MARDTLWLETTKVAAEKSAMEIISLLGKAGAKQILQQYENCRITGIQFMLTIGENDTPFSIPVRLEPVYNYIRAKRSYSSYATKEQDMEKAERIAWRQALNWLKAQLAFVRTGMVKPEEVFLPYMLTQDGKTTLYERLADRGFQLALPERTGE